jgi:hypothetical protein
MITVRSAERVNNDTARQEAVCRRARRFRLRNCATGTIVPEVKKYDTERTKQISGIGEMRHANNTFVGKLEGKIQFKISRRLWEDKIKMHLK